MRPDSHYCQCHVHPLAPHPRSRHTPQRPTSQERALINTVTSSPYVRALCVGGCHIEGCQPVDMRFKRVEPSASGRPAGSHGTPRTGVVPSHAHCSTDYRPVSPCAPAHRDGTSCPAMPTLTLPPPLSTAITGSDMAGPGLCCDLACGFRSRSCPTVQAVLFAFCMPVCKEVVLPRTAPNQRRSCQ